MNRNVTLLILLVLSQIKLFAQEPKTSKIKLKTYYNFNHVNFFQTYRFTGTDYLWTQPEILNNNIGEFSLGIIIETKSNKSHEFEWMPLSIQHTNFNEVKDPSKEYNWVAYGKESTAINSRFRYQINYLYKKQKCDLYLGIFSSFNYFFQNYQPKNTFEFKKSFSQIGLILGLTPGIELPINEKMIWSVDIPIGITGVNLRRMNTQNPSIKLEERIQSVFNGEFWHQGFQIRIGLGFSM